MEHATSGQAMEVRAKLTHTNTKIDELSRILLKKAIRRSGQSADACKLTSEGIQVSEFRLPRNKIKALPRPHVLTAEEIPPLPIRKDSGLDQLRKHNLTRWLDKMEGKLQMDLKKEKELALTKAKPTGLPKLKVPPSIFPRRYARGELPCTVEHGAAGQYLSWVCPLDKLDYEYYLPLFFDGIRVTSYPCAFIARQGIEDMLYAAKGHPERVEPSIAKLVPPLKFALYMYDEEVLVSVLRALRQLLDVHDSLGALILKHAKHFLSPISAFLGKTRNLGDRIDYGQRRRADIGDEVRATLELFEERGGPDALRIITFSIPVYQGIVSKAGGSSTSKGLSVSSFSM